MIPPHAHAAFVGAMAAVLEVDTRPDDPQRPQVCLDEPSTPLVAEPRVPIPAAPGQPERLDDESARPGTAHRCLVFEPLAGPRRVKVTERRTALDCAPVMQAWVDAPSPQATKRGRVLDHLTTHKPASRYEAFAPAEARRLMARLEVHDTPKHGSWLPMAETELRVLATPCVDRRMPDPTTRHQEVAAWQQRRNQAKCTVAWRFTTQEARIKRKRLYPSIQLC